MSGRDISAIATCFCGHVTAQRGRIIYSPFRCPSNEIFREEITKLTKSVSDAIIEHSSTQHDACSFVLNVQEAEYL